MTMNLVRKISSIFCLFSTFSVLSTEYQFPGYRGITPYISAGLNLSGLKYPLNVNTPVSGGLHYNISNNSYLRLSVFTQLTDVYHNFLQKKTSPGTNQNSNVHNFPSYTISLQAKINQVIATAGITTDKPNLDSVKKASVVVLLPYIKQLAINGKPLQPALGLGVEKHPQGHFKGSFFVTGRLPYIQGKLGIDTDGSPFGQINLI